MVKRIHMGKRSDRRRRRRGRGRGCRGEARSGYRSRRGCYTSFTISGSAGRSVAAGISVPMVMMTIATEMVVD